MRSLYVDDRMYAIFNDGILSLKDGKKHLYVQPVTVKKINSEGFVAECHNSGDDGHRCGLEYFENSSIGNGVFFSKDAAQAFINKGCRYKFKVK